MCEQEQPGDLQLTYADPRDLIVPQQHPRTDHQDDPPQTFQHPQHQLTHSVKQFGILQPILARKTQDGLQIISGRRRRTAAIAAGLTRVPVLITTDQHNDDLTLNLAENTARHPLNPIEQAQAFTQIGLDHATRKLSIDPDIVDRTRRLRHLDPGVQQLVASGDLSPEAAHQLHHAEPEHQLELARRAVAKQLQPKDVFRQAPYYANKVVAEREELKIHAQSVIDTLNELLKQPRARLLMRPAAPKGTIFLDLRSPEEALCFARRLGGEHVPDPPARPRKLPRRLRAEDPYRQPRWTDAWHDIQPPSGIAAYDFRHLFLPDHAPRYGLPGDYAASPELTPDLQPVLHPLALPPLPLSHDLTHLTRPTPRPTPTTDPNPNLHPLHLPDPRQRLPPTHSRPTPIITLKITPPPPKR